MESFRLKRKEVAQAQSTACLSFVVLDQFLRQDEAKRPNPAAGGEGNLNFDWE